MTFPYRRSLPPPLESLNTLGLDLRWTWSHAADRLWRTLDEALWNHTRNPWLVLQSVSHTRLEELAQDAGFVAELHRVMQSRQRYQDRAAWCDAQDLRVGSGLVAYFSMEYGLGEALPLYSGGLGVLAGDLLKTASDLGVPMVAAGLLYQQGYFRQMIDSDGCQLELYPANPPSTLPITPVHEADGARLAVSVSLPGRDLRLLVWQAQVGRVSLFLLDSNDPANIPADRGLTGQLYGGDVETRLVQEIVLGVGGWRALIAMGLEPAVCHLNEGHAALVTLERIRQYMHRHGVSFDEALWATRAGNVFTTHTTVAAAFDVFPNALVAKYGRTFAEELRIEPGYLLSLGQAEGSSEGFSMAFLAARTASCINAVSRLHGSVSRRNFQPLYPRWPAPQVPVGHITNGVHVPSWDSPWADKLWTDACGKDRWLGSGEALPVAIDALSDETLWHFKSLERADLVRYVRLRLADQSARAAGAAREVQDVLDPDALTLGFARRFAEYKRPHLLLTDADRLERLLTDPQRPVQLIIAGKAHPRDDTGKRLLRDWLRFVRRPSLRRRVVFLEDYDITLAQELVQGVDLWLNTPRRPWEACGTSGMKVLVNGGLNLSELDGWWAEAYQPNLGWALGDGREHAESGHDRVEAEQLYCLLEQHIVPEFHARNASGVPRAWVARMRASMAQLAPRFSSNRMLQEYLTQAYEPAWRAYAERTRDQGRLARELAQWESALRRHWGGLRLERLEWASTGAGWQCCLQVHLGGLNPEQVQVQLYAEGADATPAQVIVLRRGERVPGSTDGFSYAGEVATQRPASHFTPRVVPHHPHARVPVELALIRWLDSADQ